jgi:Queuosine salvage protein
MIRAYGSRVPLVDDIRAACARVAARARHVGIARDAIPAYARSLDSAQAPDAPDPDTHFVGGSLEDRAAYTITLDAINFGSGWFPTLHKRGGRSGYLTVAAGLRDRFIKLGPWRPRDLARVEAPEIAAWLGEDPTHELMGLFAASLRELGERLGRHGYLAIARADGAVDLAERMARWPTWRDVSVHDGEEVPFFKRAQILAADLVLAGVADYPDLDRLTMFADNLVPHVLRLDGVLRFDPGLVERIARGELLEHGSPEEVEIRACAVHAVELLSAECGVAPHRLDALLWNRGQMPRYKRDPRHRARTTAY